jgi:hypothetical protein
LGHSSNGTEIRLRGSLPEERGALKREDFNPIPLIAKSVLIISDGTIEI